MIEGVVNADKQATLTLTVLSERGLPHEIEAVIDTGYTGFLSLTPADMQQLELPFAGVGGATVVGGRRIRFSKYWVTVCWDGREQHIQADTFDSRPLVGTQLLAGHRLLMDFELGGRVLVKKPWRTRRRRKRPAEAGEAGAALTGDSGRG